MREPLFVALLLTAACGGTADPTLESDAPETTAQADAGAKEAEPEIPLCPGSVGPCRALHER